MSLMLLILGILPGLITVINVVNLRVSHPGNGLSLMLLILGNLPGNGLSLMLFLLW